MGGGRTVKKTKYHAVIVLVIVLAGYGLWMLPAYRRFDRYLKTSYPEKSFRVYWPNYDFLYGRYGARAVCLDDRTVFSISSGGDGEVVEYYYSTKNNNSMQQLLQDILNTNAYLSRAVRSVSGYSIKSEVWEKEAIADCRQMVEAINLVFQSEALADDRQIAGLLVEVISLYRSNGVAFRSIGTHFERDAHVYELRLEDGALSLSPEEIAGRVRLVK